LIYRGPTRFRISKWYLVTPLFGSVLSALAARKAALLEWGEWAVFLFIFGGVFILAGSFYQLRQEVTLQDESMRVKQGFRVSEYEKHKISQILWPTSQPVTLLLDDGERVALPDLPNQELLKESLCQWLSAT